VDLWGRVRATHDAARLLVQVSREEYDAASIMLAGQVTETWLGLLEQKARRRLLTRQIQTLQRYLEMVELRFAHGQSVATDVYAQRRQLAAAEAQIPRLEARREALAHRLAVLLGRPPLALPPLETAALPAPPPIPAGGVPGDLLQRRPDVRAAYYRVQEIDRRVAAAIADRFPALRLTGRLSDQASESANLFQDWVLNLAGNLTAPLLDGGRRRAEVQRQRARLAARLQAYGETILTAVREVEDALSAERRQRQHLARLERQLAATRGTLTVARRRYSDGVGDYLRVLTALERVQQLEQSLLTQRAQLLVDRLTLYKALAGPYRSRPRPVAQILIAQPTTESLPGGLP
jgi:NodT family efflux transporter outer membrane factor (OMF) lipoprotein